MLYSLFQLLRDSLDCEFRFNGIHLKNYALDSQMFDGVLGSVEILFNEITVKNVDLKWKHGNQDKQESKDIAAHKSDGKIHKKAEDAESSQAEQGINEMGKIIQNIINSVKVSIENINIEVGNITIHIDSIELKSTDIPNDLYAPEDLLLNLVKYFYISNITTSLKRRQILCIKSGWVRLLFLQSLEESVHQAAELVHDPATMLKSFLNEDISPSLKSSFHSFSGGLKDSILDANFELKVMTETCVIISDSNFFNELVHEFDLLRHENESKPKSTQPIPKFEVSIGEILISLLPCANDKLVDHDAVFDQDPSELESLSLILSNLTIQNAQENCITTIAVNCKTVGLKESGAVILDLDGQGENALSFRFIQFLNGSSPKSYLRLRTLHGKLVFNEILTYNSKYFSKPAVEPAKKKSAEKPMSFEFQVDNLDISLVFVNEENQRSFRIHGKEGLVILNDVVDAFTLKMSESTLFLNCLKEEQILNLALVSVGISSNSENDVEYLSCNENYISDCHDRERTSNGLNLKNSLSWSDEEFESPMVEAENPMPKKAIVAKYSFSILVGAIKTVLTSQHLRYLQDIADYIKLATLSISPEAKQPLVNIKVFLQSGSVVLDAHASLAYSKYLLEFKLLDLNLILNSLDDFRNIMHLELKISNYLLDTFKKAAPSDKVVLVRPRIGGTQQVILFN